MRFIIAAIFMCFFHFAGYAQSDTNEIKTLMDSAISLNLKDLMEISGTTTGKQRLTEGLFLMDENELPYVYLLNSHGAKISALCGKCPESKSIMKTGMNVWKIFSKMKSNQFIITIGYYTINVEEGKCYFSYGGNTKITFEYDCDKKIWRYLELKNIRH